MQKNKEYEINQRYRSPYFENGEPFEVGDQAVPKTEDGYEGWFAIYDKSGKWMANIGGEVAAKIVSEKPETIKGQELEKLADFEARLHFNPEYSKDGYTACKSCFIAGTKAAQPQPSTVLGWVDAEIELPKEGGRYWCYVEEINDLGIAHYQWNCGYHEIEKRWSIEAGNGEDKVTHWMPLLPAPNKTENPWLKVNGDDTQVNNVNYFAHVCEKHEWINVEVTASNTEPNYLVQCRVCGILKIKPNSTPTPTNEIGWVDAAKERIEKVNQWKEGSIKAYTLTADKVIQSQEAAFVLAYGMEISFLENLIKSNSTPILTETK